LQLLYSFSFIGFEASKSVASLARVITSRPNT